MHYRFSNGRDLLGRFLKSLGIWPETVYFLFLNPSLLLRMIKDDFRTTPLATNSRTTPSSHQERRLLPKMRT